MKKIRLSRNLILFVIGGVIVGAVGASLLIYLTPLKWVNVIPTHIDDIDPTVFWKEYTLHPDQYLFLDVRDKSVYDAAHAQGAINEPIANMINDRLILPRSGKKIVLICSSGRLAGVAYGFLEHEGFLNLLRIQGGTNQWKTEGLPIEGNAAAIPKQD